MKAIITVGIPASGKTTKYKDYPNIINRDDAREHLFGNYYSGGYKFTNHKEKQVTEHCWSKIVDCGESDEDIVITDTNLNKARRDNLINNLESIGYTVELDVIECSYELAVKRDLSRQKTVGSDVIWRFYKQWHEQFGIKSVDRDITLPDCYIFDIDGTLALMDDRSPFEWDKVSSDTLNKPVIDIFNLISNTGKKIFIFSGRDSICFKDTEAWLWDNYIINKSNWDNVDLYMRPEDNHDKDFNIKLEMFNEYVKGNYNVAGVFDDRPQVCRLWNLLGVPLFKVGDQKEF